MFNAKRLSALVLALILVMMMGVAGAHAEGEKRAASTMERSSSRVCFFVSSNRR